MNVELKTTGELIDELITTQLKLSFFGYNEEIISRELALISAINKRLTDKQILELAELVGELEEVSKQCWDAQEIITKSHIRDDIADAAIKAQQQNVIRTKLIRKIDNFVNESGFTRLEKSYG